MKALATLALVPALALGGDSEVSELSWLVGCWEKPDKSSLEVWVADGRHSLAGFAVAVGDNRIDFYEVLSITKTPRGPLVYTAHPAGQAATSFIASEVSENSVTFENPEHDYPQKITYNREENRLLAKISLSGGGNPNSFDKVACE